MTSKATEMHALALRVSAVLRAEMLSPTTAERIAALSGVELKPLKCDLSQGDSARKKVSCDGQVVADAIDRSGLTRGEAAGHMGISEGLLSRQIDNADNQHISWQRLNLLPDRFWRELWMLVARRRKLARVRHRVVFEMEMAS